MDLMQHDPRPIRAYMKRYGLSQAQFGDLVGASQSAVSQWLKRKVNISPQTAQRIEQRTGRGIRRVHILPKLFAA